MIKNSILIGISFLLSKILGLAREVLLASYFGVQSAQANMNLDAYFAAFKLPDLIFTIVSSGVISAAFVPLFVEYLKNNDKQHASRFTSDTLYALTFFVFVLSLIVFAFAPQLMRLVVPGFTPEVLAATVDLTRIMLVTPILFTINGILGGVNNSLSHFKGIAAAPVFYNLGIIVGTLVWGKEYGIYGISFGVILGAVASLLTQLPETLRSGVKLLRPQTVWNEHIRRLLQLALPRIAGMSITQLSLIVDTFMASLLVAGSLTYMNLATNLYFVPIGVVAVSIGVTRFGQLASQALEVDHTNFSRTIHQSLQTLLFLLIPLSIGMVILSEPLVSFLFMRGSFTQSNVDITAATVKILSIGILGTGLVQVLARSFYALKDTRTPLVIGVQTFVINILVASVAAFYLELNTYGLAMANAVSNTLYGVILFQRLTRKMPHAQLISWRELLKYLVGGTIMSVVCAFVVSYSPSISQNSQLAVIGITTLAGCITYFSVLFLLKSTEATLWYSVIKLKLRRIVSPQQ